MEKVDLLLKKLKNNLTPEEEIIFQKWVQKSDKNDVFYKQLLQFKNEGKDAHKISELDIVSAWEKVQRIVDQKEKIIPFYNKKWFQYAAAAIVVGLFATSYFLKDNSSISPIEIAPMVVSNNAEDVTKEVTLTIEDGSEIVLEKNKNVKLKGRSLNGEKLVYDAKSVSDKNSLQYNYLTIPKGRQFFVQLSDGTKVWLNSDSKLKFPVNFIRGQDRKVELVYGEAYFDVSKSTKHNGDAFRINTRIQEIKVLGTEFNIKAYQDEVNIVTTLIEGKVTVGNGTNFKILKPSEQSLLNSNDQDITIQKVDKPLDEIAWKDGCLSFKHESMKEIMKTLSRRYDVDYVFKDTSKENMTFTFTGVFDKKSSIDEILTFIQKTNEISFKINNKTVIIE